MIRRRKYHLLTIVLIAGISIWIGRKWLLTRVFASQMSGPTFKPSLVSDETLTFGFDGAIQDSKLPAPWQMTTISWKLDFDFTTSDRPDEKAIHFRCPKGHVVIYTAVDPFDPNRYPIITWRWKGITLPTDGDLRKHALFGENKNDEMIQVLIAFENNQPVKETLNYGWDTTAPAGTELEEWSPVTKLQTRVVESGADH